MIKLEEYDSVMALTGAGVSAESGVPTFRGGGASAVWKGMSFDVISSAQMVTENLKEVWEWFDYRRGVLATCVPNPAHAALAEIESRVSDFLLVTQNVDGLHNRAGSKNVVEIHGNINRARCEGCGRKFELEFDVVPHNPVNCEGCGSDLRPDIVLFGEMLPDGAYEKAIDWAERCDLFFVIGTSALVYPAAAIPQIAKRHGAYLIEINPEETPLTQIADESHRGAAGKILPSLVRPER